MFFALLALGFLSVAQAADVARPAPKFLGAPPDQAEGARILERFRQIGLRGDHWFEFELRVMPRQAADRVLTGALFGRPAPQGALTRLRLSDRAAGAAGAESRYLIFSGAEPRAWRTDGNDGQAALAMTGADVLAPVAGTDLTIFDLQMPFLFWTNFVHEGVANVRGRPAHAMLLYPPAEFLAEAQAGGREAPAAVRVFLDTQFGAMTQAEWVAADGKAWKTVTVLDLKKLGEDWVVKSIDLRNHRTRDKTRFSLTAAALDLVLPPDLFSAEALAGAEPLVPRAKIQRL